MIRCTVCLKESDSQWLLVNNWRTKDKIQIIKVTEYVNNVFLTWHIKSTRFSNQETVLVMLKKSFHINYLQRKIFCKKLLKECAGSLSSFYLRLKKEMITLHPYFAQKYPDSFLLKHCLTFLIVAYLHNFYI